MIPVHDVTPIKLAFKEKDADVQEEFTMDVVTRCLTIDCKKCTCSYVNTAFRHMFICKCQCHTTWKGHSRCLEKQQRLREELDAVTGQMKHYKMFFERGEVILEPEVLKEIGKLQRSNPDQLIITHERMHALDARTK